MIASVSTLVYMTWPDAKTFTIKLYNANFKKDAGIMCAADAKECSDGSYVSRVAPSCEFAECSEVTEKECIKEGEYVDTPSEDSFECCGNLVKTPVTAPMDENCEPIIPEGSTGPEPGWTCLACGDGECNSEYENKCNCTEDCEENILDTSDWKSFEDSNLRYELKYPEYWSLDKISDDGTINKLFYKDAEIILGALGHGLPPEWETNKNEVEIDGKKYDVIEYMFNGEIKTKLINFVIKKDDKDYTFGIELTGKIDNEIVVDYDKILSTFKFIDSEDCVTEGESYTNLSHIDEEFPNMQCCDGLENKRFYSIIDGECTPSEDAQVCVNCGDGECGFGENRCNCPEDCEDEFGIKPADSDTPAAGICSIGGESLGMANININQDTSSPRCVKIFATEKIKFTNNTEEEINIDFAGYNLVINPDESETIDKATGEYLELGVHIIPNIAEVWVVPSTDSPIPEIDTDNDGLSDEKEEMYDTDPNNPDTDGDGYLDGDEVKNGYNPNGEGKL